MPFIEISIMQNMAQEQKTRKEYRIWLVRMLLPVAIYQSKGCCPVLAPHIYIRTKPAIIEKKNKRGGQYKKASDIYTTKDLISGAMP